MTLLRILLLLTFPLSAMAEEIVISSSYLPINSIQKYSTKLNLNYQSETDYRFCEKNPELCKAIENDSPLPKFEIRERPTKTDWALFWTLQTLDVLTTREGMKYDCVKEVNPLLPEKPSTTRIILHKGIILGFPYFKNNWIETTSTDELLVANLITGVVVLSNFDVIDNAKTYCNRIG